LPTFIFLKIIVWDKKKRSRELFFVSVLSPCKRGQNRMGFQKMEWVPTTSLRHFFSTYCKILLFSSCVMPTAIWRQWDINIQLKLNCQYNKTRGKSKVFEAYKMTFIRFYFIQSWLFVKLAFHLGPLNSIYVRPTIYNNYNNIMLDIFPLSEADLPDTISGAGAAPVFN
jgi:hypothetical protein